MPRSSARAASARRISAHTTTRCARCSTCGAREGSRDRRLRCSTRRCGRSRLSAGPRARRLVPRPAAGLQLGRGQRRGTAAVVPSPSARPTTATDDPLILTVLGTVHTVLRATTASRASCSSAPSRSIPTRLGLISRLGWLAVYGDKPDGRARLRTSAAPEPAGSDELQQLHGHRPAGRGRGRTMRRRSCTAAGCASGPTPSGFCAIS